MKLTQLIKITAISASLLASSSAFALTITPVSGTEGSTRFESNVHTNADDIFTDMANNYNPFDFPFAGSEPLYKAETDGGTEGDLSSNYTTVFSNTATDPEDATITYGGGNFVSDAWLLVKDGNHDPGSYLFNLSSTGLQWNGTDTLELVGFWPSSGAISHVSLYGIEAPEPTPTPDSGATIALMGIALAGLGLLKRRQ